jgi:hypothetical protein
VQGVEPHYMAAFKASSVALQIAEMLPHCDLISELVNVLTVQLDLFLHMLEGKHYGTNSLADYCSYLDELKINLSEIKKE